MKVFSAMIAGTGALCESMMEQKVYLFIFVWCKSSKNYWIDKRKCKLLGQKWIFSFDLARKLAETSEGTSDISSQKKGEVEKDNTKPWHRDRRDSKNGGEMLIIQVKWLLVFDFRHKKNLQNVCYIKHFYLSLHRNVMVVKFIAVKLYEEVLW